MNFSRPHPVPIYFPNRSNPVPHNFIPIPKKSRPHLHPCNSRCQFNLIIILYVENDARVCVPTVWYDRTAGKTYYSRNVVGSCGVYFFAVPMIIRQFLLLLPRKISRLLRYYRVPIFVSLSNTNTSFSGRLLFCHIALKANLSAT